MSKLIPSPVQRWPGTITLPDSLNFTQYFAWQESLASVEALAGKEKLLVSDLAANEKLAHAMLPGVCACVEKWDLQNFPAHVGPDSFPATPRESSFLLLAALIAAINQLVTETDEVPNA